MIEKIDYYDCLYISSHIREKNHYVYNRDTVYIYVDTTLPRSDKHVK